MVRAMVIGIEASPFLTKGIIDLAVQPLQVLLSDETAGDARLVGDDDGLGSTLVNLLHGFKGFGIDPDVFQAV
jgi:hypothetical protein